MCPRRAKTTVPKPRNVLRVNWKYYRGRTLSLKASEARRIGEVLSENIARSSTFRWTPQKRNGYYSKQKFSSMRLCGDAGKRFRAISGKEPLGRKIIDARTCLRSEKAVIYSPRFHPPLLRARRIRAGPQWGRPRIQLGGVVLHGPHTSGRHLADHLRQHVFFHRQDVVVTGGSLGGGGRDRSSLHRLFCPNGHCLRCRATCARLSCVEVPFRRVLLQG